MFTALELFKKKSSSAKLSKRLGCHIPSINFDKEKLLDIQHKNDSNYIWYYDHLYSKNKTLLNKNGFSYRFLSHQFLYNESYINDLSLEIKRKIPLLQDTDFLYQFVKFDKNFKLAIHTDTGRNAALFFSLTDNASPTDFYRGNSKIQSFHHDSPLLLSVDVPHSSDVKVEKITFQIGFTTMYWDNLLDYCLQL